MEKTPSGRGEWVIELKPLPKIVENVKKVDLGIYLVGFKAEYDVSEEELVNRAYERMIGAGMDLIVANDVAEEGAGFGTDTNEVYIVDHEKRVEHLKASKYEIAAKILDRVREKTLSG
jgi:phosphopantothenoylcysteine decarboxylase/phosphopantothenate--cysteine ligase